MDFALIRSIVLATIGAGVVGHALFQRVVHRSTGPANWGQLMVGLGTAAIGPLLLSPAGWGSTLAQIGALVVCVAGGLVVARHHTR